MLSSSTNFSLSPPLCRSSELQNVASCIFSPIFVHCRLPPLLCLTTNILLALLLLLLLLLHISRHLPLCLTAVAVRPSVALRFITLPLSRRRCRSRLCHRCSSCLPWRWTRRKRTWTLSWACCKSGALMRTVLWLIDRLRVAQLIIINTWSRKTFFSLILYSHSRAIFSVARRRLTARESENCGKGILTRRSEKRSTRTWCAAILRECAREGESLLFGFFFSSIFLLFHPSLTVQRLFLLSPFPLLPSPPKCLATITFACLSTLYSTPFCRPCSGVAKKTKQRFRNTSKSLWVPCYMMFIIIFYSFFFLTVMLLDIFFIINLQLFIECFY